MSLDQFTTARLSVHNWRPAVGDKAARQVLEKSLAAILTDRVLKHLPPPLQLGDRDGVSSWIDARAGESEVLLVDRKDSAELLGLMILASDPGATATPTLHIGYLLAETAWGRGIASELLNGFVSAVETDAPARLVGGVDKANPASARVLEKAGFVIDPDLSTPDIDMYVRNVD